MNPGELLFGGCLPFGSEKACLLVGFAFLFGDSDADRVDAVRAAGRGCEDHGRGGHAGEGLPKGAHGAQTALTMLICEEPVKGRSRVALEIAVDVATWIRSVFRFVGFVRG